MTKEDLTRRSFLLGATVCWTVIAVGNYGASSAERWNPKVVSVFAAATAISTAALATRPASTLLFRGAGTLAIGTLTLRCVSIGAGLFRGGNIDAGWLTAAAVAVTAMLDAMYWRWWLTEVNRWHVAHRRIGR